MNERMTWEQMVDIFPNLWVVVQNAIMNGGDIISGEVVATMSDDEIEAYRCNHLGQGNRYRRTTEDYGYGIINSDFTNSVN